jgi:hypothetical protein
MTRSEVGTAWVECRDYHSTYHRPSRTGASILVVALSAYVLAALFAERRDSEARLTSSNMMLERERSNKLMNLEAMAGTNRPLT